MYGYYTHIHIYKFIECIIMGTYNLYTFGGLNETRNINIVANSIIS